MELVLRVCPDSGGANPAYHGLWARLACLKGMKMDEPKEVVGLLKMLAWMMLLGKREAASTEELQPHFQTTWAVLRARGLTENEILRGVQVLWRRANNVEA